MRVFNKQLAAPSKAVSPLRSAPAVQGNFSLDDGFRDLTIVGCPKFAGLTLRRTV